MSSHPKFRVRRASTALLLGAALTGSVTGTSSPAQAAIDPVSIASYIGTAYSAYKQARSILGLDGPTLSDELAQVQAALIAELRSQRNQALQSSSRSVFNLFRNLADNAPGDPTNADLWTNVVTLQQTTADAMFDIIWNSSDLTSAYELAPAYNTLIATGASVLKIKGEIWPDFPSSWNDHYIWLQPAINADYKMIGASYVQCYPGYNPGYWPPPPFLTSNWRAWRAQMVPNKYRDSWFWKKKIANHFYVTDRWQTNVCSNGVQYERQYSCNPTSGLCSFWEVPFNAPPRPASCLFHATSLSCSSLSSQCDPLFLCSAAARLECAAEQAWPAWSADQRVIVIKESMRGIMSVSGGNDYEASINDVLVPYGEVVDPWVDEPSCTNGPWAYPQQP